MKRFYLLFLISVLSLSVSAQNAAQARKILDKTASVISRKSGKRKLQHKRKVRKHIRDDSNKRQQIQRTHTTGHRMV